MNAAETNERTENALGVEQVAPERAPAAERLETALGEELSRFLLSALVGAQAPSRESL
jgi:hypothetical protein